MRLGVEEAPEPACLGGGCAPFGLPEVAVLDLVVPWVVADLKESAGRRNRIAPGGHEVFHPKEG